MNSMDVLIYLLKSTALSGILFAYYAYFLKDAQFHTYNRFYLLASMVLSVLIPFIPIRSFSLSQEQIPAIGQILINPKQLPSYVQSSTSIDWESSILVISLLFSLILLGFMMHGIYRFYQIKQTHEVQHFDDFDLIETEIGNAPFSFLKNLYWKKSISITEEEGVKILQHELTHIRQKHSWDRLFSQSLCSLFWMNPFYWLIQKEMQQIHEFIADEEAFGHGNSTFLAKILLHSQYGHHFLNPSHSFYYSSIKRRIIMLTTSKNPQFAYLRKVLALPLLASMVILFSLEIQAQEIKAKSSLQKEQEQSLKQERQSKIDEQNAKKNQEKSKNDEKRAKVDELKARADEEKAKTAENQVFRIKNGNLNDVKVALLDTTKVIIKRTKNGDELTLNAKKLNGTANTNSEIKLVKATGLPKPSPLIVIDGAISKGDLNDIFPQDIEAVRVLKGENALAKYPENGANGVVEITTKKK
jgi:beta-lactamase regulating signal transducer with metallopeptidase domain